MAFLLATLPVAGVHAGTPIGYSNGDCSRSNVFRAGSTEKQGGAIRLTQEKLKELKGCTISGIDAAFGSRNTTNKTATVFIATSPDATPLREKTEEISRPAQWQTFSLDEPYVITGEEGELYIGYTVEATTSTYALSCDYTADTKGCSYAYVDGTWTDMYGMQAGNINVRAVVEDVPEITDVMVKTLNIDGYYKAGTAYTFSTQLYNFGTTTINNFDVTLKVGNAEPQTVSYTDVSIGSGDVFDITLPEYSATEDGDLTISIEAVNLNGGNDDETSDNTVTSTTFFYPEDMERNLLLEGFTGQACAQCPGGHRYINNFLESTEYPIVEIMHHSGYNPDIFTMDEDYDYTFFYGSASTYAPAFMMNRTTFQQLGKAVPVISANSSTVSSDLTYSARYAWNSQPYVSLKLETTYDETTREVSVKATAVGHTDLPQGQSIINVVLIQDGIEAYQASGGDNYEHANVFRGTLTGNAWGKILPDDFKRGSVAEWEDKFTLPEAIFSSFYENEGYLEQLGYTAEQVTITTVPEDMYVVAYVGGYDASNVNGHNIYNCVKVKLGESHEQKGVTAIAPVALAKGNEAKVRVNGRTISVEGEYDSCHIYNVSGQEVPAGNVPGAGLYVVRVENGGQTTVKKVLVK